MGASEDYSTLKGVCSVGVVMFMQSPRGACVHWRLMDLARKTRGRRKRKKTTALTSVLTLGLVAVSMTFLGYKIGQMTVRTLTKPGAVEETMADRPVTPVLSDTVDTGQPSSALGTEQVAEPSPSEPRPAVEVPEVPRPTPADTQPVQPELWRVRVGSFAVREEAEAALRTMREYAPEAFVVSDGLYRLQAGAFMERERAEALAESLAERGLAPELIPPRVSEH
jgi:cell division septation protein DedD